MQCLAHGQVAAAGSKASALLPALAVTDREGQDEGCPWPQVPQDVS